MNTQSIHNTITVEKGSVLFREGENIENVFLLKSGRVVCAVKSADRLIPVHCIKDSGFIGEDCVLSGRAQYTYSAVALEKVEYIEIASKDISTYLDATSDWIQNIFINISDKIEHTNRLIAEHRIINEKLTGGIVFSEEDEVLIKKSLS